MKKLKAFTLLELLIGMIISSIVIGFGYTGYTLVYKRYLAYTHTKKNIVDIIQLNSVLNNDFINAKSVQFDTDKLILNYENDLLKEYSFRENYILRQEAELMDTFKLAATNIVAVRNPGQEEAEQPVTEISFDALIYEETMHFHFTKTYSAETMINIQVSQWPQ